MANEMITTLTLFISGFLMTVSPVSFIGSIYFSAYSFSRYILMLMNLQSSQNKVLTVKLLNRGYQYHKFHKMFLEFYQHYSELVVKYRVG